LNGKKIGVFLTAVLLSGAHAFSFGQTQTDLAFIIRNHAPAKKADDGSFRRALESGSELKSVFVGLIRVYQILISSQDTSVCNFTVSCSRFGMTAVQKYGIIHGLLMASDRLQRCTGFGRANYPLDLKTGLAVDFPLETYYLGKVN
jgi:putative component of membrane protein insertase Oxa1/YidC/SpoIIIJ protein YidD